MIVVLDTNVFVSALLSPFGPPGRILDLVLAGDVLLAFDDRILEEYRQVLQRPRFGFDQAAVTELLIYIEHTGQPVIALPLSVNLPDPDDLVFLDVAATAQVPLISGNLRHFPIDQRAGVTVYRPEQFWQLWSQP
jgi:putative PIN family toxin of toxin-antitoxin system